MDELCPISSLLWQNTAALTIYNIWMIRVHQIGSTEISLAVASAVANASLHFSLGNLKLLLAEAGETDLLSARARVLGAMAGLLSDLGCPAMLPFNLTAPEAPQYLLSFDGGSKGNPGPGVFGAVIVKVAGERHEASVA